MIAALTLAAVVVAVAFSVTAIRSWRRERPLLYVLVPLLLAFAVSTGHIINQFLGYATGDLSDLQSEFRYLHHVDGDPVYLLAVPDGAVAPRLYAIPQSMLDDEARRGLAAAEAKAKKGVPEMGVLRAEGEMRLYDFDVQRVLPKTD